MLCPVDKRLGSRRMPGNKLNTEEREQILKIACSAEFRDKTPWQIVPTLADRGIYIGSEASFYRILRQEKLLAHRQSSNPPRHERPKELVAIKPNQVWSWDITYLKSNVLGKFYYLYLAMDIYSRKIVAWDIAEQEKSEISSKMIRKACLSEGVQRHQLFIHSDNGGPMKGATMLATLRRLGVLPSFSRPRVSDDNAFSESLFKTMKYSSYYPRKPFSSVEEAKEWFRFFLDWYNNRHLHSGIKYVSPAVRHQMKDSVILMQRRAVYEEAKTKNPLRWVQKPRNWEPVPFVILNAACSENDSLQAVK